MIYNLMQKAKDVFYKNDKSAVNGKTVQAALDEISEVKEEVFVSDYGLKVTLYKVGKLVQYYITGTTTSVMSKSAYNVLIKELPEGFKTAVSYVNYQHIGKNYTAQCYPRKSANTFIMGYFRDVTTGSEVDLPSGTNIYASGIYLAE